MKRFNFPSSNWCYRSDISRSGAATGRCKARGKSASKAGCAPVPPARSHPGRSRTSPAASAALCQPSAAGTLRAASSAARGAWREFPRPARAVLRSLHL